GPRPSVRESEGTVVAPRVARLPQDRSCGLRVVPVPLDIRVVPVFEYRRDRVFALYGGSAIQKRLDEALLVDGLRQRHPELFVADERDREHEFGIERREVLRGHLRDGVGLTRTGGLRVRKNAIDCVDTPILERADHRRNVGDVDPRETLDAGTACRVLAEHVGTERIVPHPVVVPAFDLESRRLTPVDELERSGTDWVL